MSLNLTRKKVNLLAGLSALLIVILWIVWIAIYNPYSYEEKENIESDKIFSNLNQATSDIKADMQKSQEQWETLQKYLQQNSEQTTSTYIATSTPEDNFNEEAIEVMKNYLNSTSTSSSTKDIN